MIHRIYVSIATAFFLVSSLSCAPAAIENPVFSEETLSHWSAATFPSSEASARYHWGKHASYLGITPGEYTKDARLFFNVARSQARRLKLKNGEQGFVIRTPGGGPGGYFTEEGKIVSYWYSYARHRR